MDIKKITNILETIVPGSDSNETEIYFEPLSMSGLEEMNAYSIDERLYEFFEFKPFKSIDDTKNYINKLLNKRMSYDGHLKKGMYWFVRHKIDNILIGTASIVNIDYLRKSGVAKAQKKEGRSTKEGLVVSHIDSKFSATLLNLNLYKNNFYLIYYFF